MSRINTIEPGGIHRISRSQVRVLPRALSSRSQAISAGTGGHQNSGWSTNGPDWSPAYRAGSVFTVATLAAAVGLWLTHWGAGGRPAVGVLALAWVAAYTHLVYAVRRIGGAR